MKNSFNLGFIVLLLVVLGCSCPKLSELANKNDTTPTPSSSPGDSSTPVPTKTTTTSGAALTKEKADQIKDGMNRAGVEKILGEGEEVSTTKGGGMTFVVMKWTDEKYNYVIVSFKNDKAYNITKSVK